jgi:hypothetical protein
MDNFTFYCLFNAFRCSLSWPPWLLPNKTMVQNPLLRWSNCKANSGTSSDMVIMRGERVGRRLTTWGRLWTSGGGTWFPLHSQNCAFCLNDLTWNEIKNLLSNQVQISMMKHGNKWTYKQSTRLLIEQFIISKQNCNTCTVDEETSTQLIPKT